MAEKAVVTPWEVSGKIDYDKLIKEFGLSPLKELPGVFNENVLFRRKIVFVHQIRVAHSRPDIFDKLTGLYLSLFFHACPSVPTVGREQACVFT